MYLFIENYQLHLLISSTEKHCRVHLCLFIYKLSFACLNVLCGAPLNVHSTWVLTSLCDMKQSLWFSLCSSRVEGGKRALPSLLTETAAKKRRQRKKQHVCFAASRGWGVVAGRVTADGEIRRDRHRGS